MTCAMDGQVSMFDPDTWSGKTSPEPSPSTKAKTSRQSSQKSQGSSTRPPLMCLCLRRVGGPTPESSTTNWEDGLLPIGYMTLNTGAFRKDADGLLSLQISTDSAQPKYFLTLNCGEKPRVPNPTKLSEILEQNVDEKYNLSAKACQGILNRAEKRGKELPEALLNALTEQVRLESTSKVEKAAQTSQPESPQLLQATVTERHTRSVSKNEPDAMGGARESSCRMNEQEPCQPSTTNPCFSLQGNTIDRSPKMNGGVAVAASLEGNGARPSHQGSGWGGGDVSFTLNAVERHGVAYAVDCRNGTENPFVNGTLQAKEQGQNLNSNNVVRVPNQNSFRTQDADGGTREKSEKPSELPWGGGLLQGKYRRHREQTSTTEP